MSTNNKIPEFDRSNWPISDEILLELGRIVSLWIDLENYIDTALGKLAGFDSISDAIPFILIKHSSFPQKLNMLSALCHYLLPEYPHLENYNETISKIKTAQTSRNRYLHNTIIEQDNELKIAAGSARGKLKTEVTNICIDDLKEVSIQINSALRSLHLLITRKTIPPIWEIKK